MPLPKAPGHVAAQATATVLAVVLVVLVWVLTPWHPLPGAQAGSAQLSTYFSPQQIARSEQFHDASKWPAWFSLGVGVAVPVLLGCTRLGRRLVTPVRARLHSWPAQVAALGAAVVVLQRLATLPFGAWSHSVAVSYGLSTRSWGPWTLDVATATAISAAIVVITLLALVGLARRFPFTWFAPAGLAAGALVVLGSFAYPIVIEPLFNSFTPMPPGPLRSRLLALAARDSVDVNDVLVADASRRTTALNAYISGFGASRRIVVYDTLLASSSDDEVAVVVAHELGHAAQDDVLVGTVEGAVGAAAAVCALFLLLERSRVRRPLGVREAGDPGVVPIVLALLTLGAFAAAPVQNLVSRHIEARADTSALDLTRDPQTFIAVQQQLAVSNLAHLQPNPVLAFWFSNHPDALDRIALARQWERLRGQAP